jgi:hypothetical protein
VSSILDALKKVDQATPIPAPLDPPPWAPATRSVRRFAAAVLGAFAAGAGVAIWFLAPDARAPEVAPAPPPPPVVARADPAPLPRPGPVPAPVAPAKVEPAEPAIVPPVPAPAAPAPERVARPPVTAVAPVAPPPRAAVAPAPAPAPVATAPAARQAGPTETAAVARVSPSPEPAPAAPPPEDEGVLPRPPAGAPSVRLSFLLYSRAVERRTVSLTLASGEMLSLREGDTVGDLEVARILPDRVHLRHQGRLYLLRARD